MRLAAVKMLVLTAPALTAAVEPAAPPAGTAIRETGKAVTDVGQIFGQGGTDGLILYALLIGTFLMFLLGCITIWFLVRLVQSKDAAFQEQSNQFATAAKESAEAMRELATATAAKVATDTAHQSALTAIMARLEAALARLDGDRV